MEINDVLLMLVRLGAGAIATFLAILLWSKTRDIAWVLVVMGVLVTYAEIVLDTLERFGIVSDQIYLVNGFPLVKILLANLPLVFISIAFAVVIARKRFM